MQNAETVLNVIHERGERGLPLENIYRLLYNRNLYLRAYGRIASNQGATTKGATAETVDGMSLAKIDRIITKPCATSGSGGRRCDGSTFPSLDGTDPRLGHTNRAGQAAARGHPDDSGSLLRAAVFRPFPRLSAPPGLSHRT